MSTMRAQGISVTTSAVFAWVAGRAQPLPRKAKLLLVLSEGHLTWDDVYAQPLSGVPR
ncbi:MAG TPA: hypothetical protein VNU46_05095 [Gemmatimonadaceae bacterium]|nr:hypothetical protein [Gemmatimonadaceae bacterium]